MGETQPTVAVSHAAGGRAAGRLAARRGLIGRFLVDQRGATAVEYGLICALVFLVIVTSVSLFGTKTTGIIETVSAAVSAAIGG
ncbi:MAG: Flp family type IVb pilin [Caulobacter sp.]